MVKIVVNNDKCTGCGTCKDTCPVGVYEIKDHSPRSLPPPTSTLAPPGSCRPAAAACTSSIAICAPRTPTSTTSASSMNSRRGSPSNSATWAVLPVSKPRWPMPTRSFSAPTTASSTPCRESRRTRSATS